MLSCDLLSAAGTMGRPMLVYFKKVAYGRRGRRGVLNENEVRNLISIVKRLKSEGITILYISHRISEVLEISDRVTVLKDGNYVSTLKNENVTEDELIHLMVGREVDLLYSKKKIAVKSAKEDYLELENVSKENFINDISFNLHKM